MSAVNRVIKGWQSSDILPAEKRKRPTAGDYFGAEDPQKRARAEQEQSVESEQEYKIRGKSGGGASSLSPHRPSSTTSRNSISSPVRGDSQQTNETSTSTSRHNAIYPLSLLSRSPEHLSDKIATDTITEDLPELRRTAKEFRLLHSSSAGAALPRSSSTELKQPKALRVDTAKVISDLDPRSPAHTPEMASEPLRDERSKYAFSLGRTKSSRDVYPKSGSPLSRRPSETMAPPPSASTKPARSESSTPKLITPVTARDISLPKKPSVQTQAPLLDTLNRFAQSIQFSASLKTQQDMTAQQLAIYEKDRQRQKRLSSVFTTLVEDTDTKFDALNQSFATLEKHAEQKSADQDLISRELAQKLETKEEQPGPVVCCSDTLAHEKAVQKQLGKLQRELKGAKEDIADFLGKVKHLAQIVHKSGLEHSEQVVRQNDLEKSLRGVVHKEDLRRLVNKDDLDHYMTKYGLDPMENKLAEHRADLACEVNRVEIKLGEYKTDVAHLDNKITDILLVTQERKKEGDEANTRNVKCFEGLSTNISKTQANLSLMEQTTAMLKDNQVAARMAIDEQERAFAVLSIIVCGAGDNEEPGLKKLFEDNSRKLAKIQESTEQLRESLQSLGEARADVATVTNQSSVHANTKPDPKLKEDLVVLRNELDKLKEDQRGKDDCVSSDIEKLENLAKEQDNNIALLREDIRRTNTELGRQWSQTLALSITSRPTHPPTPLIQSRAFTPQDVDHVKLQELNTTLQELKTQTNALETTISAQQQKFDGLTSDHVVSCMVTQMIHLYPHHPNSLPNQVAQMGIHINQVGKRQAHTDHHIVHNLDPWRLEVNKKLDARPADTQLLQLSQNHDHRITELTRAFNDTRNDVHTVVNRINALQTDVEKQKGSDLAITAKASFNQYRDQVLSLINRVDAIEAGHNITTRQFANALHVVASDVTALNHHLKSLPDTPSQAKSKKEITNPGSEPDWILANSDATIRNSKSIDAFGNASDDSDVPLSGRQGRSKGDADARSIDENPLDKSSGWGKLTAFVSPRKRKRPSEALFLENGDQDSPRRVNGKCIYTGET